MDSEIYRFIILAWITIHLMFLYPIYRFRGSRNIETSRWKLVGMVLAILGLVLIGLQFHESLRSSEIGMIMAFPGIALVIYVIPQIVNSLTMTEEQEFALRPSLAETVLADSLKAFTKKVEVVSEMQIHGLVKLNRFVEIKFETHKDQGSTKIENLSRPVGGTITNFRVLAFFLYYTVIVAAVENSFLLPIPFTSFRIDAELTFVVLLILMFILINMVYSTQEQFHTEFIEIQDMTKLSLVKKMASKKKKELESKEDGDSSSTSVLETTKEKMKSIKELRFKEEIQRRQEEMKNQINSVLGDGEDGSEHFESDIYKKQKLIRKISKILNSTPIGKEIPLMALVEKVGNEDEELVESIIIGLISNNRVKGKYDIWDRRFLVGDASSRFIEQALEHLQLTPGNYEYIKISRSGDVEIKFDHNGKTISNSKETM